MIELINSVKNQHAIKSSDNKEIIVKMIILKDFIIESLKKLKYIFL